MRRVIVLGASGFFGRAAMELLQEIGIAAIPASRSERASIKVDVNDAESIRQSFNRGDVVVDAAGPFRGRSSALIGAAIEIGFDLIDINEDLNYAEQIWARKDRIDAAGIRVISSASTVSAIAAAMVRYANVSEPIRITAILAPALRKTANRGVAVSMIQSLGQPIRVWRDGAMRSIMSSDLCEFQMPSPIGPVRARRFESADSLFLPMIWPKLRNVEMYVAARTPAMNLMLTLASRSKLLRHEFERFIDLGIWMARRFGPAAGGIGYEILSASGQMHRVAIVGKNNSFITAVTPAVLATRAIAEDRFTQTGLILPHQHVEPMELIQFLQDRGIEFQSLSPDG